MHRSYSAHPPAPPLTPEPPHVAPFPARATGTPPAVPPAQPLLCHCHSKAAPWTSDVRCSEEVLVCEEAVCPRAVGAHHCCTIPSPCQRTPHVNGPPPPSPPFIPQDRTNMEDPEETGHGKRGTQGEVTGKGRPRSPKTVQSQREAKDKRKRFIVVVRSPCQEDDPTDAHTSANKSVLELANPAWIRSVHLDAPGQRHGQQPVSGTAEPGVVKRDKSFRGSVNTTKTRSDPQRTGMYNGERPIGAAKGKQTNTMASYQPPPPGQQHTWLPCQSPLTLEHHGQLMSPLEPQSCLKNIAVTFMFRESPWSPEPCNTHGAVFCLAKCSALECPHRSATIGCAAFPDMRALHVNPLSSEGRRLGMSMLLSIPNFGGTLH